MKSAPFSYVRPRHPEELVNELVRAENNGGGKVIAGGQSLLPVLAMRLGRPGTLVDATGVTGFGHAARHGQEFRVGAAVRQRAVEKYPKHGVPLLRRAIPWIGHREIRSRGTVCGSIAHADPSAELPAVATCLDASIDIIGPNGPRSLPASEFFLGAMTTALESSEAVAAVRFPVAQPGDGFGFSEVARRHGDFALAGVAIHVNVQNSELKTATIVSFGVSDRPRRVDLAGTLNSLSSNDINAMLDGEAYPLLSSSIEDSLPQLVTTAGDAQASREYKQHLVKVLATRELKRAIQRASAGGPS